MEDAISSIRAAQAAIAKIYQSTGGDEELLEFYTDDAMIVAPSFDVPVTKREHLKEFAKKRQTLGLVKATTEEYEIEAMGDSCAYSTSGAKFMNAQDCIIIQIKDFKLWKKVNGKWLIYRRTYNIKHCDVIVNHMHK
eukprot:GHVO01021862.1.p1 GENE.GHVO01021862.1~~GHVO01021862.1.p1  ORF type:complete len:137 (+),score=28.38 GHVO01021862.1:109-519(+)